MSDKTKTTDEPVVMHRYRQTEETTMRSGMSDVERTVTHARVIEIADGDTVQKNAEPVDIETPLSDWKVQGVKE